MVLSDTYGEIWSKICELPRSLNLLDCNVGMEGDRIPKRVFYMNMGTTRLRGRPRSRWQDEVREDGRIAGGEG